MREIVLDTETTGLDPAAKHKIVEIACVEVINYVRTGRHFHAYINPERDMPEEAFRIHGLSEEFLRQHKIFPLIASEFLEFVCSSPLVIHNAGFDLKFLNYELKQAGFPSFESHPVVDTLHLARKAFPGSPANLDALCRRFKIDLSQRVKHGALLDAELLADVYLELRGGKQPDLAFKTSAQTSGEQTAMREKKLREPRHFPLTPEELAQHQEMRRTLPNALWEKAS